MDVVSSATVCIQADAAEGSGAGHGTQALTLGNLAEGYKCDPDCTCEVCRPDLDLERMRAFGLVEHVDGKDYFVYLRNLLEVFSVKFLDFVGSGGRVRGNMTIPVSYGNDYHLFGPDTAERTCIQIDRQGYGQLADATCDLEVSDNLAIFFKLQRCDDETSCEMNIKERSSFLWNSFDDPVREALCKRLETGLGPVEVTFAIMPNALPAHVEVRLLDWPLDQDTVLVDGYVFVGNTDDSDPNSVSFLFRKPPGSTSVLLCRPLEGGSSIPLPLSKNYTSVPRDSTLEVYIQLELRFEKGFRWIAREVLEFPVMPSNFKSQIINGEYFSLEVIVTWLPLQMISFEERTKNLALLDAAAAKVRFKKKGSSLCYTTMQM